MTKLRVVVVGVGRIGSIHAQNLSSLPHVSEVLLVDSEAERARVAAAALPKAASAISMEAALDSGVDAMVIATPTDEHYDGVRTALERGLPTFCEKPLTVSRRELVSIMQIPGAPNRLMVGFQRRFDPSYRRLQELCKDAIAHGAQLSLIRLATSDREPPSVSYLERAGSLFHDMLIHDFDILRFLHPRPVISVSAHGSPKGLWLGASTWGTAVAICRFDDGAMGVVSGTRANGRGYQVTAEVTLEEGLFAIGYRPETSPYEHVDDGRDSATSPPPHADFAARFAMAYRLELAYFVDAVCEPHPLRPGLDEMAYALSLAEAADKAAATGVPQIPVPALRPDESPAC